MNPVKKTCLALACITMVYASSAAVAETAVEEGQRLFREHCRDCHDRGSPNGYYTPLTLIQSQWERFFRRKYERYHRDVIDEAHGGVPVTEAISPEILEKIKTFSVDHAADTDQPMTCG